MTTATVADVARPARAKTRTRATCGGSMRDDILSMLAERVGIQWPDTRYWERPVAFSEEILGMRVWPGQERILNAYVQHKRVSVRSGHKIGKSCTAAIIALHFYCSKPDARVVFTSTTARQVDAILWRELGKIRSKAGCCLACRDACARAKRPEPRPCPHSSLIGGTMNSLARSGFRAPDYREVSGFTARDAEAVAGISGANLLYLPDEASGIDDTIFEAIEGNRAGGARMVMFSNPTRTEGEFFRSHTDKALKFDADGAPVLDGNGNPIGFYFVIQVSSDERPNVLGRREVFPGLAGHEWVEEKRLEWGEDSPLYKIRVKGEFVTSETGKIISVALITESEARWYDAQPTGRLHIGVDPAGEGAGGDESAFAVRRGNKILKVIARRGLSADAHVTEVLGLIREHRFRRDAIPVVTVDAEGEIGIAVAAKLKLLEGTPEAPGPFELVQVKASNRLGRPPYDRVRDALWGNLRDWLRNDGAIPEDVKLAKELHAPAWIEIPGSGVVKVTPKSELRKMLGRSPDRADALALAVWEPVGIRLAEQTAAGRPKDDDEDDVHLDVDRVFNPYRGDRAFDPYGGAR